MQSPSPSASANPLFTVPRPRISIESIGIDQNHFERRPIWIKSVNLTLFRQFFQKQNRICQKPIRSDLKRLGKEMQKGGSFTRCRFWSPGR